MERPGEVGVVVEYALGSFTMASSLDCRWTVIELSAPCLSLKTIGIVFNGNS